MTERYLTLLVVPHDEHEVHRWRVPYRWLPILAGAAGILLVAFVLAVATYGRVAARATRAALLERENARLAAQNAKVKEIAANLERTERAYAQIREMAGLPPDTALASAGRAGASAAPARAEEPPPAANRDPDVPSGWPLAIKGFVSSGFSGGDGPGHPGIDIAVPAGTPVLATADGTVAEAREDSTYGWMLVLRHADGLETMYGHNAELLVEPGDEVRRGETIATSGNSGRSTAPHLHYEVRRDGHPVDPGPYLR